MPVILIFLLVVFIIFLFLFLTITTVMLLFDLTLELPYVGTGKQRLETILKLANIKKGQTIIDLGSGDGRLLIACAQKGATAIGYELNPFMVFLSKVKAMCLGYSSSGKGSFTKASREVKFSINSNNTGSITVHKQTLWEADLKSADIIFVYSLKKYMQKFEDFVYKNAKKGTRVIVNTNPFPNKKPKKQENGIYLYIV